MVSFPRPRRARLVGGALTTLALVAVAACGGDPETSPGAEDSSPSSASPSPTPDPSQEPTASPTPSPSPTTGSPEVSPSAEPSEPSAPPAPDGPGAGGPLRASLLSAELLAGLNEESSWSQTGTGPVGSESFGWCQRFDALTLGASEGVQRTFRAPDARAAQQVLDMVDATNATRAEQVLRGWHRDCGGAGTRVGRIQTLQTGADSAWWYLSRRHAGGGRWEGFGFARQGDRVTLVQMTHPGQDHSYEPGTDPAELATTEAAGLLG